MRADVQCRVWQQCCQVISKPEQKSLKIAASTGASNLVRRLSALTLVTLDKSFTGKCTKTDITREGT